MQPGPSQWLTLPSGFDLYSPLTSHSPKEIDTLFCAVNLAHSLASQVRYSKSSVPILFDSVRTGSTLHPALSQSVGKNG